MSERHGPKLKVSFTGIIPGFGWRNSGWRERHHGTDTPLDGSCSKYCPTSEAVSYDSNPGWDQAGFSVPRCVIKQMIE